ncbi:hypothetical protein PYK22_03223 [Pyrinomonas methylaliphatogenes]|uniref:Uncharacterized protein n=1 Tax=Pyrinomonas methylaliphatogenes TaxID=454194 RepID=A0A0B6X3V0_9BACT|nr:hypothetical protein PYK22_03223 [Pyrinomonas methylaliphatogenes]
MDPFYFVIGGFVIFIFIFKMEMLVRKESFRIILGISFLLFLIGLVLHFTEAGRSSLSGALLCPLLSLGLFRLLRRVFLRWFKHEPRDTFFNWNLGLGEDRIFNILYFAMAILLWMVVPFGMEQLAKVGW